MKDKFGREIRAGAIIIYGHALGRANTTRVGRVLKVRETERGPRITVIGVDDDHWSHDPQEPRLCAKPGTILFPDRVIVVPGDLLPEGHKRLLSLVALADAEGTP